MTYETLVLSGGGVSGIIHLGAIKKLETDSVIENINNFVGTSVGGIICGLLVVGYTADELYTFMEKFPIDEIKSFSLFSMLEKYGLDDGNIMEHIFIKLIEAKITNYDITLKELYELTQKNLTLTTVCLNRMEHISLSHLTHPNLSLRLAMRMTSAIPYIFAPVNYENDLYVDGGIVCNFPITGLDMENTIAINLKYDYSKRMEINCLENYIFSVFITLLKQDSHPDHPNIITFLQTGLFNAINFNMEENQKKNLFQLGEEKMCEFLSDKEIKN